MAYADYSDKYSPGEYYRAVYGKNRFLFTPNTETTMDSESFQRFLNLQRDPEKFVCANRQISERVH